MPGVYPYFCTPHDFMRGTITVLEAPSLWERVKAWFDPARSELSLYSSTSSPVGSMCGTWFISWRRRESCEYMRLRARL